MWELGQSTTDMRVTHANGPAAGNAQRSHFGYVPKGDPLAPERDIMHPSVLLASHVSAATSAALAATQSVVASGGGLAALLDTTVPSAVASILPSGLTTTVPITASAVSVPEWLELTAGFVGALSGGLVGVRMKFDIVGVLTIALAGGLAGGIIRDVLLQKYGIYALTHPALLLTVIVGALIAFYFQSGVESFRSKLFLVDALALGLFAIVGADKAIRAGLTFIPAIMLGTITSVGGGMLRDILRNEVPSVLKPGALNGAAAVLGATTYVTLVMWLHIVKPIAMIACVLFVIALRVLAVRHGWQAPTPRDLTPPFVTTLIAPADEWDEGPDQDGTPGISER